MRTINFIYKLTSNKKRMSAETLFKWHEDMNRLISPFHTSDKLKYNHQGFFGWNKPPAGAEPVSPVPSPWGLTGPAVVSVFCTPLTFSSAAAHKPKAQPEQAAENSCKNGSNQVHDNEIKREWGWGSYRVLGCLGCLAYLAGVGGVGAPLGEVAACCPC